ncbi:MAG TPA: hypothetical protein VM680_17755 [Verrucomicrobiae bacterium]|nr:hypothetical protein [Verrucomicrobiae bacterium]
MNENETMITNLIAFLVLLLFALIAVRITVHLIRRNDKKSSRDSN